LLFAIAGVFCKRKEHGAILTLFWHGYTV